MEKEYKINYFTDNAAQCAGEEPHSDISFDDFAYGETPEEAVENWIDHMIENCDAPYTTENGDNWLKIYNDDGKIIEYHYRITAKIPEKFEDD